MEKEKPKGNRPPPKPPAYITDQNQIEAGEERWQVCPLSDCKNNPELLYEDFYLRGIRSNRLMCSACAVRMEVGYIAREVAKAHDDSFFPGTRMDYVAVFFTTVLLSVGVNSLLSFVSFIIVGIIAGIFVGLLTANMTRRFTKKRMGRYSPETAVSGIVAGFFLSPTLLSEIYWFTTRIVSEPVSPSPLSDFFIMILKTYLPQVLCTGIMTIIVYRAFRPYIEQTQV